MRALGLEPRGRRFANGHTRPVLLRCLSIGRKADFESANRGSNPRAATKFMQRSHEASKKLLQSLKEKPCKDCGKSYPHYVMEFDHLVPRNGGPTIAALSQKLGQAKLLAIASECDVVCANCHKIRTHNRRQIFCSD